MIATSLMEMAAALALEAVVLASLLSALTSAALTNATAWELHASLFAARQVEHHVDVAAGRAGTGPNRPPAVASASTHACSLLADTDGNGRIDARTAERTAFELRPSTGDTSLVHRLGRQSMAIDVRLPDGTRFAYTDAAGNAALAPSAVTTLSIPTAAGELVAALPQRLP